MADLPHPASVEFARLLVEAAKRKVEELQSQPRPRWREILELHRWIEARAEEAYPRRDR